MKSPLYFETRRPRIFGHRGSAGTHPENTLASFEEALRAGATHLELDVHGTRDGHVVVLHDDTVDRTTDGSGPVASFTLEELQRLDASARFEPSPAQVVPSGRVARPAPSKIPLLSELLAAAPSAPLNIDVKAHEPGFEAVVLDVLRHAGALDRTLLASEDAATLGRIRTAEPTVATCLGAVEVYGFLGSLGDRSYEPPGLALQIPAAWGEIVLVSAETVAFAHQAGLEVHVWTVDDPAEMKRLVGLGVDGIITNLPALACRELW